MRKWDWQKRGGIFVPLSYQRDSIIKGGHPYEDHINVVWADSVVNEPLDDTEFGLAKLGLRRGLPPLKNRLRA